MPQRFRNPLFWLVFACVSALCSWLAVTYYPKAFPIVQLEIKMDRQQALAAASALAAKGGWGPKNARQTAGFELDERTQNYVELAVGGSEAFSRLMNEGLYAPYTWQVRHFQEGDAHEALFRFKP